MKTIQFLNHQWKKRLIIRPEMKKCKCPDNKFSENDINNNLISLLFNAVWLD